MTSTYILIGVYVITVAAFAAGLVRILVIERRESERYVEHMTRELREENKELINQVMYLAGRTWRYPYPEGSNGAPEPPEPEPVFMEFGEEMTSG